MGKVGVMAAMGEVVLEEDEMGEDEDSIAMAWSGTGKQIKLLKPIRMLLPENIKPLNKAMRSGIR